MLGRTALFDQDPKAAATFCQKLCHVDQLTPSLLLCLLSAAFIRLDGIYGCHYTAGNMLWNMMVRPDDMKSTAERQLAAKTRARAMQHFRDFVDKAPLEHPQVGSGGQEQPVGAV